MTDAQIRNIGWYVLYALAGAVVATGLQFSVMLSGTDPITARPLAATFTTTLFGALATAYGASRLVRPGSENIAAQVDALKDAGVPRSEMVVLSQDDAAVAISGDPVAMIATMSEDDLRRVRDAAMARHTALGLPAGTA